MSSETGALRGAGELTHGGQIPWATIDGGVRTEHPNEPDRSATPNEPSVATAWTERSPKRNEPERSRNPNEPERGEFAGC
jgi:hypothetical protein